MTDPDDTPRCGLCRRTLTADEPQTCRRCTIRTLTDLNLLEQLHPLLSVELHDRVGAAPAGPGDGEGLPFADLLALIGPGSMARDRDAQRNDPPSVVGTLAGWEDDWRGVRGLPGAEYPESLSTAAQFLRSSNQWAANRHPAYADYAHELRALLGRVRAALRLVDTPVEMPARCIQVDADGTVCGGTLVRDWDDPRPCVHRGGHRPWCDQGGLRDRPRCVACGRVYSAAEYHVAFHEQLASARAVAS